MQIEKQAKELMTGLAYMKTALIVGGLPMPNQIYRLRQGVQIVCATPGRLSELMEVTDIDFSEVKTLVIDEVDVLLQMGFEKQVVFRKCWPVYLVDKGYPVISPTLQLAYVKLAYVFNQLAHVGEFDVGKFVLFLKMNKVINLPCLPTWSNYMFCIEYF